jgi:hypothetical protein
MLDASATEDEVAAGGPSLTLHRCSASPARDQCGRPLPANLPRERVIVPAPPSNWRVTRILIEYMRELRRAPPSRRGMLGSPMSELASL